MGILDSFSNMNDPMQYAQMQALLGAGQGLLSASGYSHMPISTGQAMAAGIQGYQGGMKSGMETAMTMQQLRMAKMQQDAMRALAEYYGGSDQPQQPQPQQQMPSMPDAPGVTPQNSPMGISASPSMASMPQQQPQQPPQSRAPYGMPGPLFAAQLMMDPKAAMGVLNKSYEPIPGRPGAPLWDSRGNILGIAPDMNNGTQYDVRTKSVSAIPGALTTKYAMEDAAARAKANYEPMERVDASGRKYMVPKSSLSAPAVAGGGSNPTLAALSPLEVKSQEHRANALEEQASKWQAEADSAQHDNLLIDRMRQESQGFEPNKMASSWGTIREYLNGLDPNHKIFGDQLGDFQAFRKNAVQLSSTAARAMGAREPGSVISMFRNAYPNEDMTRNAMNSMFTQIQGMNDYKVAQQSASDQWRQSHNGTLDGFQAAWNKAVDPMFMVVRRMPPEVRAQYFQKLGPLGAQTFAKKYSNAINSGLIPPVEQ